MAEKKPKKPKETEYPWERQEGEGVKAFEAFNTYMLMGTERSLDKVAYELNKSRGLMAKWSGLWRWVERTEAWDIEQEKLARKDQIKEIKKMRERHATLATNMLAKVTKRMLKMSEEELTPQDVKAWVEAATKLERLSRGDTSEVIEERDGGKAENPVQFYIPDNGRDRGQDEDEDEE